MMTIRDTLPLDRPLPDQVVDHILQTSGYSPMSDLGDDGVLYGIHTRIDDSDLVIVKRNDPLRKIITPWH